MGFLSILKLLARTSNVVAWPLITLVYPLYASIRAIEGNSLVDNRKWLSFWVLCGLIMLFEFTAARLIEWLPFWPYVKLMVTFWLVVPNFNGAVYAYDNFVRPLFSVNPQTFGNWLRRKKDGLRIGISDDFLLHAEKFVQENGSEALESLIYGKVKQIEPNPLAENHSVASMVSNEAETQKEIKSMESLAQTKYKAVATTDNKETKEAGVVVGISELPQSANSNKSQKESACALSQVCTQTEVILHNYFQGKKYRAKEKECMESTLAQTDNKEITFTKTKTTSEAEVVAVKCVEPNLFTAEQNSITFMHNKDLAPWKEIKSMGSSPARTEYRVAAAKDKKTTAQAEIPGGGSELPQSSSPNKSQKNCSLDQSVNKAVSAATENKPTVEIEVPVGGCEHFGSSIPNKCQKEWTCALCQVCAPTEAILRSHLRGKKHWAKKNELREKKLVGKNMRNVNKPEVEKKVGGTWAGNPSTELSKLWCEKCKLQCNSLPMLTDHLLGRRHLGYGEQWAQTEAGPGISDGWDSGISSGWD